MRALAALATATKLPYDGAINGPFEARGRISDKHNEHLSKMTKSFNGYHFCRNKKVETVYNTETCLAYLQSVVDGGI